MLKNKLESSEGFMLVEVLVAVALLAIIGVGLLTALGGATKVLSKGDIRETARDLAQAQMEYVQSQEYDESGLYTASTDIDARYPGFQTQTPDISPVVSGLQKIVITVQQGTDAVFTLEGRKVLMVTY